MIHKILNKLKGLPKPPKTPIEEVVKKVNLIRTQSEYLAICPNNTDDNWLGIKRGTNALFPNSTLILDQYYSNSIYNKEELSTLAQCISKANFSNVFFRGFPNYFEEIITNLNINSYKEIWVLYAGPISEFIIEKKRNSFSNLIALVAQQKIKGLGFNKIGMAEAISKIYNIRAERYINKSPVISNIPNAINGTNIGVFTGNTFNKNKHTQVLSSLLVNQAKVHVFGKQDFNYLPNSKRIINVEVGLEHNKFIQKLGQMTINSYLAYSESWGNVILESAAVGVPCLTTANNGVYFLDKELEDKLVVRAYDDVTKISKQMQNVIDQKDDLKEKLLNYTSLVNEYADHLLSKNFFNNR